ncbi:hypothetical protein Desor_0951 [Desulfosporosinus orientis DSM 765]|uniref:Reverse transcriptase (RNA-dependent DNA polymerase) n=1 Tax=Desulfosporosinus orientis (strain ATCC 19365 / DSM 765 / NCIMB 8382 / VKM B-1628 / Singapore I) TaxID=768706 RepID=G7W5I0_DESOD|nr:hypothetical protein [Desulfosporosinus orientis]AET66627.1 hypothetical protein Desor_0951 [Desulfosporosinus orientis DSM 765]
MDINNYYNFKNPVRHFLNINKVRSPRIDGFELKDLSWTEPIKFRVRKQDDKYRTLKMPNILNFLCSYERFKDSTNFLDIWNIDTHKRLVPNLETGDFATGIYDEQLESDFQQLCIYDNLLKLDIKSYYGRIYTHDIEIESRGDEKYENYITNLNLGNTNGLIMGNYISLYLAEKYLKKISAEIENTLERNMIDCSFSYFSDDFYFFCNIKDNEKVIKLFDDVLEKFDLERNDGKIETWTYLSYNNYNLIEKYWKKIRSDCKSRYDDSKNDNKLYFINQLIYRMSNLEDDKLKKTFLNTFFKSTYFQTLNIANKFAVQEFNFHQLCYIFKFSPETMLYAINKFKHLDYFSGERFKKFLKVRYSEALSEPYNEEQLYYYYIIKVVGHDSILGETTDIVAESNNQLLISYYLKDYLFSNEIISRLKLIKDKRYWFQNYHLILFSDLKNDLEDSIGQYLIPEYATKERQKKSYMDFYKMNLEIGISIIEDIDSINHNINKYIELLIGERIEAFGETEDEDVD